MSNKRPTLSLSLLRKIFIAANIRRWNDQATPVEFIELDKQAHKIVIAYFLAYFEIIEHKKEVDFHRLILQFCYEFFERIILTDIKPPVFHRLSEKHNKELVDFVCNELSSDLSSFAFFDEMREYLYGNINNIEKEILKASHYYASKWEFDIIYNFNPKMYDVENIKSIIDSQVESFYSLAGIRNLVLYHNIREVIGMFGQLRFQKRWSQTPRIPATSVLGHTLVVALVAFLLGYDLKCCRTMQINHFFCGLFHDLPEILTRDIISPIKRGVEGLDKFIKQIEDELVSEKILTKIPKEIAVAIVYFIQDEFANRYKDSNGEVRIFSSGDEILQKFNDDESNAIFGEFLKYCDHLSAFLEAKISIAHGISSPELVEGAKALEYKYNSKVIKDIDLGVFYREFGN